MRGSDKKAVALKYDKEQQGAPRVTAKGKSRVAGRIEASARENGIPVMDIPRLAESLFEVELGCEIPEEFYSVTAEVLSFVYSLEEKK